MQTPKSMLPANKHLKRRLPKIHEVNQIRHGKAGNKRHIAQRNSMIEQTQQLTTKSRQEGSQVGYVSLHTSFEPPGSNRETSSHSRPNKYFHTVDAQQQAEPEARNRTDNQRESFYNKLRSPQGPEGVLSEEKAQVSTNLDSQQAPIQTTSFNNADINHSIVGDIRCQRGSTIINEEPSQPASIGQKFGNQKIQKILLGSPVQDSSPSESKTTILPNQNPLSLQQIKVDASSIEVASHAIGSAPSSKKHTGFQSGYQTGYQTNKSSKRGGGGTFLETLVAENSMNQTLYPLPLPSAILSTSSQFMPKNKQPLSQSTYSSKPHLPPKPGQREIIVRATSKRGNPVFGVKTQFKKGPEVLHGKRIVPPMVTPALKKTNISPPLQDSRNAAAAKQAKLNSDLVNPTGGQRIIGSLEGSPPSSKSPDLQTVQNTTLKVHPSPPLSKHQKYGDINWKFIDDFQCLSSKFQPSSSRFSSRDENLVLGNKRQVPIIEIERDEQKRKGRLVFDSKKAHASPLEIRGTVQSDLQKDLLGSTLKGANFTQDDHTLTVAPEEANESDNDHSHQSRNRQDPAGKFTFNDAKSPKPYSFLNHEKADNNDAPEQQSPKNHQNQAYAQKKQVRIQEGTNLLNETSVSNSDQEEEARQEQHVLSPGIPFTNKLNFELAKNAFPSSMQQSSTYILQVPNRYLNPSKVSDRMRTTNNSLRIDEIETYSKFKSKYGLETTTNLQRFQPVLRASSSRHQSGISVKMKKEREAKIDTVLEDQFKQRTSLIDKILEAQGVAKLVEDDDISQSSKSIPLLKQKESMKEASYEQSSSSSGESGDSMKSKQLRAELRRDIYNQRDTKLSEATLRKHRNTLYMKHNLPQEKRQSDRHLNIFNFQKQAPTSKYSSLFSETNSPIKEEAPHPLKRQNLKRGVDFIFNKDVVIEQKILRKIREKPACMIKTKDLTMLMEASKKNKEFAVKFVKDTANLKKNLITTNARRDHDSISLRIRSLNDGTHESKASNSSIEALRDKLTQEFDMHSYLKLHHSDLYENLRMQKARRKANMTQTQYLSSNQQLSHDTKLKASTLYDSSKKQNERSPAESLDSQIRIIHKFERRPTLRDQYESKIKQFRESLHSQAIIGKLSWGTPEPSMTILPPATTKNEAAAMMHQSQVYEKGSILKAGLAAGLQSGNASLESNNRNQTQTFDEDNLLAMVNSSVNSENRTTQKPIKKNRNFMYSSLQEVPMADLKVDTSKFKLKNHKQYLEEAKQRRMEKDITSFLVQMKKQRDFTKKYGNWNFFTPKNQKLSKAQLEKMVTVHDRRNQVRVDEQIRLKYEKPPKKSYRCKNKAQQQRIQTKGLSIDLDALQIPAGVDSATKKKTHQRLEDSDLGLINKLKAVKDQVKSVDKKQQRRQQFSKFRSVVENELMHSSESPRTTFGLPVGSAIDDFAQSPNEQTPVFNIKKVDRKFGMEARAKEIKQNIQNQNLSILVEQQFDRTSPSKESGESKNAFDGRLYTQESRNKEIHVESNSSTSKLQSDITSMNIPDRSKYSESESIPSSPTEAEQKEDASQSMFILEPEEVQSRQSNTRGRLSTDHRTEETIHSKMKEKKIKKRVERMKSKMIPDGVNKNDYLQNQYEAQLLLQLENQRKQQQVQIPTISQLQSQEFNFFKDHVFNINRGKPLDLIFPKNATKKQLKHAHQNKFFKDFRAAHNILMGQSMEVVEEIQNSVENSNISHQFKTLVDRQKEKYEV